METQPLDVCLFEDDLSEREEAGLSKNCICPSGYLVWLINETVAREWPLFQGPNLLGRREEDHQQTLHEEGDTLAVDGILIPHSSLSRKHAIIFVDEKGLSFSVQDLGSVNKTFTGSMDESFSIWKMVKPYQSVSVSPGQPLKFGQVNCLVNMQSSQPLSTALNPPPETLNTTSGLIAQKDDHSNENQYLSDHCCVNAGGSTHAMHLTAAHAEVKPAAPHAELPAILMDDSQDSIWDPHSLVRYQHRQQAVTNEVIQELCVPPKRINYGTNFKGDQKQPDNTYVYEGGIQTDGTEPMHQLLFMEGASTPCGKTVSCAASAGPALHSTSVHDQSKELSVAEWIPGSRGEGPAETGHPVIGKLISSDISLRPQSAAGTFIPQPTQIMGPESQTDPATLPVSKTLTDITAVGPLPDGPEDALDDVRLPLMKILTDSGPAFDPYEDNENFGLGNRRGEDSTDITQMSEQGEVEGQEVTQDGQGLSQHIKTLLPDMPEAASTQHDAASTLQKVSGAHAEKTHHPTPNPKAATDPPTTVPAKASTDPPTTVPAKASTDPPTTVPAKASTDPPTTVPAKASTDPPTTVPAKASTDPPTTVPAKASTDPPAGTLPQKALGSVPDPLSPIMITSSQLQKSLSQSRVASSQLKHALSEADRLVSALAPGSATQGETSHQAHPQIPVMPPDEKLPRERNNTMPSSRYMGLSEPPDQQQQEVNQVSTVAADVLNLPLSTFAADVPCPLLTFNQSTMSTEAQGILAARSPSNEHSCSISSPGITLRSMPGMETQVAADALQFLADGSPIQMARHPLSTAAAASTLLLPGLGSSASSAQIPSKDTEQHDSTLRRSNRRASRGEAAESGGSAEKRAAAALMQVSRERSVEPDMRCEAVEETVDKVPTLRSKKRRSSAEAAHDKKAVLEVAKRSKKQQDTAAVNMTDVSASRQAVATLAHGPELLEETGFFKRSDVPSGSGAAASDAAELHSKTSCHERRNLHTKGAPAAVEAPDQVTKLQQEERGSSGLSIITDRCVKQETTEDGATGLFIQGTHVTVRSVGKPGPCIEQLDLKSSPQVTGRQQSASAAFAEPTVPVKLESGAAEDACTPSVRSTEKRRGRRSFTGMNLALPSNEVKVEGSEMDGSNTAIAKCYKGRRGGVLYSPPTSLRAVRRSRTPSGLLRREGTPTEAENSEGGTGEGSQPVADDPPQLALAISKSIEGRELREAKLMVSKLRGRVTEEDDHSFTHLLMMPGCFKQSLKTLIALASGHPLVNPAWVDACKQSSSLLRVQQQHIALDARKERELKFSAWGCYQRVISQGRVLEVKGQDGLRAMRCMLGPSLMKGESDPRVLPLIISHAGGVLVSDIGKASRDLQNTDCIVFGDSEDKDWASKHLPAGMPVFSRDTLITGVVRGAVDKSSAVFIC
ncbi:hypothetical protein CEUSTIGMA_g6910.t1 [Chlamydomonas eustigma]|uniref:FHA domain-containing protein n=1 Tax=Chlamydomonas eustigma TaxID=1157962 RepID=A0A250X986_9CHLO|nr:hypothetical protein CEUSTIGMA_g6910.t1 [Chlamydomonas eustigma]|eukprot:GAX79469.1 hypothetical protein CEUSTIGMA_g6910.t1 [Chlamydomonas eustigma]